MDNMLFHLSDLTLFLASASSTFPLESAVNMSVVFGNPNESQLGGDSRTVFRMFPRLVPEIRRLIWECALLFPSTIVRQWNNRKFSFALRRPVPPVLQTCRETRLWFIQGSHKRSKKTPQFEQVQQRQGEEQYIYIDWKIDTVYIHRECKRSGSHTQSPPC